MPSRRYTALRGSPPLSPGEPQVPNTAVWARLVEWGVHVRLTLFGGIHAGLTVWGSYLTIWPCSQPLY